MKTRHFIGALLTLALCLWHAWAAAHGNAARENPEATDCFSEYLNTMSNASETYATNYQHCMELGTNQALILVQQQNETRKKIKADAMKLCKNFQLCDEQIDSMQFFQCNVQHNIENLNILINIKLNSSAAMVNLEQGYSQEEKEVMLCTIREQRQYVLASTSAYETLMQCLGVLN